MFATGIAWHPLAAKEYNPDRQGLSRVNLIFDTALLQGCYIALSRLSSGLHTEATIEGLRQQGRIKSNCLIP